MKRLLLFLMMLSWSAVYGAASSSSAAASESVLCDAVASAAQLPPTVVVESRDGTTFALPSVVAAQSQTILDAFSPQVQEMEKKADAEVMRFPDFSHNCLEVLFQCMALTAQQSADTPKINTVVKLIKSRSLRACSKSTLQELVVALCFFAVENEATAAIIIKAWQNGAFDDDHFPPLLKERAIEDLAQFTQRYVPWKIRPLAKVGLDYRLGFTCYLPIFDERCKSRCQWMYFGHFREVGKRVIKDGQWLVRWGDEIKEPGIIGIEPEYTRAKEIALWGLLSAQILSLDVEHLMWDTIGRLFELLCVGAQDAARQGDFFDQVEHFLKFATSKQWDGQYVVRNDRLAELLTACHERKLPDSLFTAVAVIMMKKTERFFSEPNGMISPEVREKALRLVREFAVERCIKDRRPYFYGWPHQLSIQDLIDHDALPAFSVAENGDRCLVLDRMDLTSLEGLEHIPGIETVQQLSCTHNKIKQIAPGAFAACASLEQLNLNFNESINIGVHSFDGLHNLRLLNLRWCQRATIDNDAFNMLGRLEHLDIGNCRLPDFIVTGLSRLPHFRELHLEGNGVSEEHLLYISRTLPSARYVVHTGLPSESPTGCAIL